jgi:hypothetical protein
MEIVLVSLGGSARGLGSDLEIASTTGLLTVDHGWRRHSFV